MKRLFLPFVVACLAAVANAQDEPEPVEVTLPDNVMRQVVERVVVGHFATLRRSRIVYFSEQNIKRSWLPKLNGIEFVIASATDGKEVHFFRSPERVGKDYQIDFGWGDPDCDAEGEIWSFKITGRFVHNVELAGGGWGSGCSASADGWPQLAPPIRSLAVFDFHS